jgi:hypothetical protein
MEALTDIQRQILDGHLLGDGYLRLHKEKGSKNAYFAINRKLEDEDYSLKTYTPKDIKLLIQQSQISNR